MNPLTLTTPFEGKPLTTYFWEGRPSWIAKEVGRLMEYADEGGRLVDLIRQEWRDELLEGHDYELLEGERLASFKARHVLRASLNRLLLLRESGVHLACLKTEKPVGRRLRRWLAEEVLPSLLRGQGDTREVSSGRLTPQEISGQLEAHAQRLLAAKETDLAFQGYQLALRYRELDRSRHAKSAPPPPPPVGRPRLVERGVLLPHLLAGWAEIAGAKPLSVGEALRRFSSSPTRFPRFAALLSTLFSDDDPCTPGKLGYQLFLHQRHPLHGQWLDPLPPPRGKRGSRWVLRGEASPPPSPN